MADSAPYVYCLFPLPKDIVLATLCYKNTFPLHRYKSGCKKKNTHYRTAGTIFVFCLVWLLELTFFSDKSCQNRQVPDIKYETFKPMCIGTLFSCRAHSTSLIMALLQLYRCSKLAIFFLGTLFLILTEIKNCLEYKTTGPWATMLT